MGFPAIKAEGIYRNSRKDIIRFLNENHGTKYKVWNLCKEPGYIYDHSIFDGRVSHIPFPDHNCPTLLQMLQFCEETSEWMSQDDENMVVVHCKAGKGRTGLMISCLLCFRYQDKGFDSKTALDFFGVRRTDDAKGVTIRSQIRFVHYLWTIITQPVNPHFYVKKLESVFLTLDQIIVSKCPKFGRYQSFKILWGSNFVYDSLEWHPHLTDTDYSTHAYTDFGQTLKLYGEVKLEFYQSNSQEKKDLLFYCWFHCGLLKTTTVTFPLNQLDGKAKSSKHQRNFDPNTQLSVFFS